MNADDPKLTAYALGELTGEEEARVAAEISSAPELARAVAETRNLTRMLQGEYEAERAAEPVRPANLIDIRDDRWFWGVGRPLAIAATIAIFAIIGAIALSNYQKATRPAVVDAMTTLPSPDVLHLPPLPPPPVEEAEVVMDSADLAEPIPPPAKETGLKHGVQIVLTGTATPPPVDITTNKAEKLEMKNLAALPAVRAQVLDSAGALASNQAAQAGDENDFVAAGLNPRSSFPVILRNASYAEVQRSLQRGTLPPRESIRLEEMINHFSYDYPEPADGKAISVNVDATVCPWETSHRLVRVGLKGGGKPGKIIAREVNAEVEFNPARVMSYRLLGYEKRGIGPAGGTGKESGIDVPAGQVVTALYEILPAVAAPSASGNFLNVKLRYKAPAGDQSEQIESPLGDSAENFATASPDLKFIAAVAEFAMLLRDSEHKGSGTLAAVLEWAEEGKGADPNGDRAGFIELVKKAQGLTKG